MNHQARCKMKLSLQKTKLNTGFKELHFSLQIETIECTIAIYKFPAHGFREVPVDHRRKPGELTSLYRTIIQVKSRSMKNKLNGTQTTSKKRISLLVQIQKYYRCSYCTDDVPS